MRNQLIPLFCALSAICWAGPDAPALPVRNEATWIWGSGETNPVNERRYFRGNVFFANPPRVCLLKISADSRYSLWINGRYIVDGPARGGDGEIPFDRHEVGKFLMPGNNTVAVLVQHVGGSIWGHNSKNGGLSVQMDWLESGHRRSFISSEDWKNLESREWGPGDEIIGGGAGYFESYDARMAVAVEWTTTWFDDSEWENAGPIVGPDANFPVGAYRPTDENRIKPEKMVRYGVITDSPEGEMFERSKSICYFRNPVDFTVRAGKDGESPCVIYDFGRMIAGSPRVETDGGDGAIIEVSYSGENGNGFGIFRDGQGFDRYICRGGMQSWGPTGVRGFRFVRLKFRNIPAPIRCRFWAVGGQTVVKDTGYFRCSDKKLNSIWKACVRTLDLCTFDVIVDNPVIQGLSAPDVLASVSSGYVLRSDRDMAKRALRLIGGTADADGYLSGAYPQIPRERADENGLLWIISMADYFKWTGDYSFISTNIPQIKLILSWYGTRLSSSGLLEYSPSKIWIDDDDRRGGSVMKKDCNGASASLNALYAGALDGASVMADVSGFPEYSIGWRSQAADLRKAVNGIMWNQEEKCFYDCISHDVPAENRSQQSNILCALYGGVPSERVGKLLNLVGIMGEEDHAEWALIGTPYFERFRLEALAENGMTTQAVKLIKRRWGAMMVEEVPVFGEKWTNKPGMSVCQARSAHPVYFLITRILGVTPAVGGMSKVRISPEMGGLEYASGGVPTQFGMIEVEWKKHREGISLEVLCPAGVEASVELPVPATGKPVLRFNERRIWKSGESAPEGVIIDKEMIKVKVDPGKRVKVELF